MIAATFNINGMNARLGFVQHWLAARRPDVVALQELKLEEIKFPFDKLAHAGYRSVVHGQKSWNGVALLVRESFGTVAAEQVGLPGAEDQGSRLLAARVRPHDHPPFTAVSVYVPNGKTVAAPDFGAKLRWLDALDAYLRAPLAADEPLLVAGDFNLCPGAGDSWNEERFAGHIFHTDEERARYRSLERAGLGDAYRTAHPEGGAFSWWDYRAGAFHKNQGLRIDLILLSRGLLDGLRDVTIDREYRKKKEDMIASDHAPVLAEIDLPAEE